MITWRDVEYWIKFDIEISDLESRIAKDGLTKRELKAIERKHEEIASDVEQSGWIGYGIMKRNIPEEKAVWPEVRELLFAFRARLANVSMELKTKQAASGGVLRWLRRG